MKKQVLIRVDSLYQVDGETDKAEFFTEGTLYQKEAVFYLLYEMVQPHTVPVKTTIKIHSPEKLMLTTSGETDYVLNLEKSKKTLGYLNCGGARTYMGINPLNVDCKVDENGGTIRLHYTLETNAVVLTENKINVSITLK